MLLQQKARAEAKGFIFDVITTVRDPVSHIVQSYDFALATTHSDMVWEDVMSTAANPQMNSVFGALPMTFPSAWEPWSGGTTAFIPKEWMMPYREQLEQLDFIFFESTETMEEFLVYLEVRFQVNVAGLEIVHYSVPWSIRQTPLSMIEYQTILQRNTLDHTFVSQARDIGSRKLYELLSPLMTVPVQVV